MDRWSSIHVDLLHEIAKKLYSYHDYIRLRLVCKEWNSKIPRIPNHGGTPWLLLPYCDDDVNTFETERLEEEGIYHIRLPEMQHNLICGSCYGWLICVTIRDGSVRMLNPFTKAQYGLPPISTFPEIIAHNPDEYIILDLRDDEIYAVGSSTLRNLSEIWKLAISSPPDKDGDDDFMAVAIYGECQRLAFWRRSESDRRRRRRWRWRDIPLDPSKFDYCFEEVIFLRGKIYATDVDARLYEFDTTSSLPVGGLCEALRPPAFYQMPYDTPMNKYLIGSADGRTLFMIIRYFDFGTDDTPIKSGITCDFDIFRLDNHKKKDDANKQWSKVYSLGNYVPMIGYNSSVWMLGHSFVNGGSGHIYYTDNLVEHHAIGAPGYQDIGIFNSKDKSIKRLLLSMKSMSSPVWLLP